MNFHDHPLLAPGKGIVVENTDDGKAKLLQRCIQNGVSSFNTFCSDGDREWFKEFLPVTLPKSLISALESLRLFKCFSGVQKSSQIGYTSVKECCDVFVGDEDFPIQFPKIMIMTSTKKEERLLSELSHEKVDLTICVQTCIEKIANGSLRLNEETKRSFCFYVLEKQSMLRNWWKIQTDLNSIRFIRNGTRKHHSANDLYDPNDQLLLEVFLSENKFPDEDGKKMDLLRHLKFQNRNSSAYKSDIVQTCQLFDSTIHEHSIKEKKSKALLQVFRQNKKLFNSVYNSIQGFKILPFKQDRDKNYPLSMAWYSNSKKFVSLEMIFSSKFEYIAGSVLPTCIQEWEELIDTNKAPQLNHVMQHFCLAMECYNDDEHAGYSYLMREVYQHLAQTNLRDFTSLVPQKCILTELGFQKATDIYIERNKTDVDLAPYYFLLPKEYSPLKRFFERLGCNKKQSCYLLVEALKKIDGRQLEAEDINDVNEDMEKVKKILKKLSEYTENELVEIREEILVPIHSKDSSALTFRLAHECAYSDSDWFSKTFTEEDNICLIHSKIDKEIAKKLGVKSLKKYTLSDAEEIFSEFGQSEPLTQRLNRLLEEGYTDGLSVPKELIQNADDAGASEVYFLYDERENKDARSCLIDPGMEGCQGPALWAFNNAVFSASDFQNIQKLSGATKKEDTTKIGKFGLGFNAVYNLTDVPSFASGKHLVYLDPHGKYLGEAIIHEKSPGIKLNLLNKTMLRKLENQFKPFQNVFGFKSSEFSEKKGYNGTIFRFPLRTKHQALDSEISSKEYSRHEMEKLLKMFCKSSGNLLLFTQNVKKIKLFHVGQRSTNPDKDMELVLTVEKEETFGNSVTLNNENILSAASRHCSRLDKSLHFSFVCKTKITIACWGHSWVENLTSKEETNWLISWALGRKQSLKLFLEKSSDGALPLSSVAIPGDVLNKQFSPRFLCARSSAFKRYGFYETGHLFCFLPLPIKTSLAFHVNGTFAVSSDRQRILVRTEDDKENTKQTVWNNCLISDATLEALLELLIVLKNTVTEDNSFYELWPKESEDCFWETFQHEFYRCIVERELPIFKTHLGYRKFQDCIFLHIDVKADKRLHQVALDILKKTHLEGRVITEVPDDVYSELENCLGTLFLEHVVTYERFITESFLPSISLFNGEEYNHIVLGALRSRNNNILSALQKSECIATSPSGTKKSPRSLVHPRSLVSGIFITEDERFPVELFCKEDDLEILVRIGMMKYDVPFELLHSQTRAIANMSEYCTQCALSRSKEIVSYLHRKFQTFSKENLDKISSIAFLPVGKKPMSWPVKWHSETDKQHNKLMKCKTHKEDSGSIELFEKPNNLYFPSIQKLVGCSQAVIGRYELYQYYERELQSLGVRNEKDVDSETLKLQLVEITKVPEGAQNKEIEDICFEIYRIFAKRLSEPGVEEFIQMHFPDLPCVITEKTFAYPKQVIFSLMHDCSPHFFGLRPKYAKRFSSLMEIFGVRKSFEAEDIIHVLFTMKEQYGETQMPPEELALVCRIAILFENCHYIPTENLYLPDSNGFLCHVNELCIDDFDWITTTESMRFLNNAIPLSVAQITGIKSKRDQSILNDSEEFGDEFGQHEELTTRIRRILDGYPEACILKELLQNADDAGASELHFIKDFRSHGTKHVLSDNWKELQGPALCVYNDSVFTEKDLEGIQNLGIGSKADDPTTTGQYGVGFNVVYHLTDVPSFITRDLKIGLDTLCVLDPHLKYIPRSSSSKPGRKFQNASKTIGSKFTDTMSGYLEESGVWKSSRGTLFRFPLRCNDNSLVSQRTTTCKELERLFDELKKEMAECLLFLNNVRTISISLVEKDGTLKQEFIVTADASNNSHERVKLHQLAHKVRQEMKKNSTFVCKMDRKETLYHLKIDIDNQCTQEWLIVCGFGFKEENRIPDRVRKAYEQGRLALLPSSGVAFNLKNKRLIQSHGGTNVVPVQLNLYKAYCFLPLPLITGLPVHINGHFALDHEARRNISWSDDSSDFKLQWNKCLIENVIVPTYVSTLQHLKTVLFPEIISRKPWKQLHKYHQAFPYMRATKDKIWEYTAISLYNQITETKCCIFPIVSRDYQKLEMADGKDSEIEIQPLTEHENKNNPVIQEEPLEIKWVAITSGSFPAYFDEIKFQVRGDFKRQNYDEFYGKNYNEIMRWASKRSEFLAGVLKDIGMKLIESPMWIYNSMEYAGAKVQTVSPEAVLQFLKSYDTFGIDKCKIENVNIHVSETRFRCVEGVVFLLDYCLKDSKLSSSEFEHVPLLITADQHIREFSETATVFITSFPELLPAAASKVVHLAELSLLKKSKVFQPFVENLHIEAFSSFVSDSVPMRYCRGMAEPWYQQSDVIPNLKWIKMFWCFLSENLTCLEKEQIQKKNIESLASSKTKKKVENKDDLPIVILCRRIVGYLGEYSFFPACMNNEHLLYPFKHGKHILKIMPSVDGPEQKAMTMLNVPVVDEDCLPSIKDGYYIAERCILELLKSLAATVESVNDTLDCLFYNRKCLKLESKACKIMLDFFAKRVESLKKDEDCQSKLRSLPFYCGLACNYITLSEKTIIVLPDGVPVEGLNEFGVQMKVLFIRSNGMSSDFLKYLGCIVLSEREIYIDYILPNFKTLSSVAIMLHLKFIKDIVLPGLNYFPNKKDKQQLAMLENLLRNIAFLPTESGRLARACEFFNPHNDLFKIENELCSVSELPLPPFDEPEWECFLVHCGMKSDVTPEIFVDFACRLQRLANSGLSGKVIKNSKLMVRILFTENTDLLQSHFLVNEIQGIRFLVPHSVRRVYLLLAPQLEYGKRLVSFRDSTLPSNDLLVWSVMGIISEDIANMMNKTDISIATKKLGLCETPSIRIILDHTRIVCGFLKDKMEGLFAENDEVEGAVTSMMTRIYKYLQKNANSESKQELKTVPFIFIKDRKLLVLPEQVVLDINKNEEIPPYLCKAPLYFGQFHPMFEMHGAAKSLESSHLANVLYEIWKKSKGNVLEPNERYSTEKAVQILFSKLRTEKAVDLKVPTLYLPSKRRNLVVSDSLVYVDNKLLEERIGNNMPDIDFFVGFKELKMIVSDPVLEISLLPEKHRPHLLSKVVVEKIESDCKAWIIPSDFGTKLQRFLHSPEFFAGIFRLVRDELYNNDKSCGEKEEIEILEKLQSVVVLCVERLTTTMTYENKPLTNTSRTRSLFSTEECDESCVSKLFIYFKVDKCTDILLWIESIAKRVSGSLNAFLGKPLKENQMHLPDLLKCIKDPSAIEGVLDDLEIRKIDEGTLSKFLPFMPELGSEISISLHHLLDNSCTYIEPGEFVAYELFDPIIDEDETCDTEPVYILARILKTMSNRSDYCPNADEWSIRYLINVGREDPIEAVASKVYKFIRNDTADHSVDVVDGAVVFSWNNDRVKSYIRDVLKNAFKRSDQEFKRTVKRLVLQYHPDKHQDNKEYFNELTVFIYFIKKRLEEGLSVEDIDIFESFKSTSQAPTSAFARSCHNRGSSYARSQRNYQFREGTSNFFRQFYSRGSQPGQARRWFRQAESDFRASSSDKIHQDAYNWACYKCHQSAEKALKALLYQIDADKVDRTHSLAALSYGIDDVELPGLACHLEGITGNYFQMRYPDAVPGGHGMATPSDIYTKNQAEKAVEFAGKILELVRGKIPNL